MYPEYAKLLLLTVALLALLLSSCISGRASPPTEPPPTKMLPRSMKGYELYSWQAGQEWIFVLITATNRVKTYQEIAEGENGTDDEWVRLAVSGVHDLEATLDQLPPGTVVAWMGPRALRRAGTKVRNLVLPPKRVISEIETYCADTDVRLQIIQ